MSAPLYESIDDYLAKQPAPRRVTLRRVREVIARALPNAVEGISYQMPVFKVDGRMVLYFAGFQEHYSIYPASAMLVAALGPELEARLHSKATIRFSYDEKVPARLIARIARQRAAEAAARMKVVVAKTARPKGTKAAGAKGTKRRDAGATRGRRGGRAR